VREHHRPGKVWWRNVDILLVIERWRCRGAYSASKIGLVVGENDEVRALFGTIGSSSGIECERMRVRVAENMPVVPTEVPDPAIPLERAGVYASPSIPKSSGFLERTRNWIEAEGSKSLFGRNVLRASLRHLLSAHLRVDLAAYYVRSLRLRLAL
jgi:hypothetical protein